MEVGKNFDDNNVYALRNRKTIVVLLNILFFTLHPLVPLFLFVQRLRNDQNS